jgi:hypothetical protein
MGLLSDRASGAKHVCRSPPGSGPALSLTKVAPTRAAMPPSVLDMRPGFKEVKSYPGAAVHGQAEPGRPEVDSQMSPRRVPPCRGEIGGNP